MKLLIESDNESAIDRASGLVLARPQQKFIPSYIDALTEGMIATRHKNREEEIQSLLNLHPDIWAKFEKTYAISQDEDNHCLEDLFWLTKDNLFLGFVSLRYDLGPVRRKYGGNTGRELRPGERNKGYGTIALELTKRIARARGYLSLEMVTAFDNMAAIQPWKKCGAEFVERFENPPSNYYSAAAVKYRIALQ